MKYKALALIFILFLSGCAGGEKVDNDEEWNTDVLIAQDCGMDGLQCCLDQEPQCQFGQTCCFAPNNPEIHYCADECDFGKKKMPCRLEGPVCDEGLGCKQDYCVECGESGNPCCQEEVKCKNQESLSSERAECINNICTNCGADGEVACPNQLKCLEGNLLNNDFCFRCGGLNRPCCKNEDNSMGCDESLECNFGFCS